MLQHPTPNEFVLWDALSLGQFFDFLKFMRFQMNAQARSSDKHRLSDLYEFILEVGEFVRLEKIGEFLNGICFRYFRFLHRFLHLR